MSPDKLRVLDDERIRVVHRNCLLSLGHPVRGEKAVELLEDLHRELTARAKQERQGDFLPMLGCVGYNVKWRALESTERRLLLDWIINSDLPHINDDGYMATWGTPSSSRRYRCLIDTLGRYIERYGYGETMDVAVRRWTEDLHYVSAKAEEQKLANP